MGGGPAAVAALEDVDDGVVVELGEEYPTHRGLVRGEPGPEADGHGHDSLGGDAGDVDDVGVVEHGHRDRFLDLLAELLEERLGDVVEVQRPDEGVPDLEMKPKSNLKLALKRVMLFLEFLSDTSEFEIMDSLKLSFTTLAE